jgi:hypothetical protein
MPAPLPDSVLEPIAAPPANAPSVIEPWSSSPIVQTEQIDNAPSAPDLPFPNEFSGAPPIPGTRRLMALGEAPEEYTVEHGDTLFDICDQLLDEPDYWPKLWSLNPDIKNPHYIFPGMKMRFYPGDESNPPFLQVVAEDDVVPIDKGMLDIEQLSAGGSIEAVMEEEGIADTPIITPDQISSFDQSINDMEEWGKLYNEDVLDLTVPGFIYEDEIDALGEIIIGSDGHGLAGTREEILLESVDNLRTEAVYTVLRPTGKISNKDGDSVGYLYYFTSNIRIKRKLADDDMFLAVVEDGIEGIMPGDIVVNYTSTKRAVSVSRATDTSASVAATVVAFNENEQAAAGAGYYVFIDRGRNDGVQVGQQLPIYQLYGRFALDSEKDLLPTEDTRYIGKIRIIDATDVGAVGYILQNSYEVMVGDFVGKG